MRAPVFLTLANPDKSRALWKITPTECFRPPLTPFGHRSLGRSHSPAPRLLLEAIAPLCLLAEPITAVALEHVNDVTPLRAGGHVHGSAIGLIWLLQHRIHVGILADQLESHHIVANCRRDHQCCLTLRVAEVEALITGEGIC